MRLAKIQGLKPQCEFSAQKATSVVAEERKFTMETFYEVMLFFGLSITMGNALHDIPRVGDPTVASAMHASYCTYTSYLFS